MAGKLGLSNEVKEIKIGKSFAKGDGASFHTFRYDFMPASLDITKRSTVDIGEGNQVTVTVPHIEGSGNAHTVFKGSKKPYQKECVLIIDHATGEITLEKLGYNVQLKKTRAEGSSKIPGFVTKKSPSNQKQSTINPKFTGRSASPLPAAATKTSPGTSGGVTSKDTPTPIDETAVPDVGILSSSGSSGSRSSGDSSDSSDGESGAKSAKQKGSLSTNVRTVSPKKKEITKKASTNVLPSMPKFSQLSEDLQLSESDSDSES